MADVSSGIKLFGTTITLQNRQVVQKDDDHDHDRRQAKKADDVHEQTVEMKRPEKIIPCPRCKSLETKFCYFNNYNVNQPRHFCKGCQRYWTAGGALRNVPVGAGRRKTKPPGRELTGFPEGCLYEAAEVVHQFELDGVVEEWHVAEVAAVKGDFRHVFPVVKRRRSSGSGGQKCS